MFSNKTIEDFYDYLKYDKQFRPATITGYKKTLGKVERVLGTLNLSRKDCKEWMRDMQKKEYSASYINNTAAILSRYMSWRNKPVELIRVRKPEPLVKDTLTEGEIARILAAAGNSREKAMLSLLAYAGLRASELCNLKVQDLDLDNGVVKVINGKGGRDGVSYIPRECCKMISEYLESYETNPHLFKTLVAKVRYTPWALRKMVKKVAKSAGIDKRVYPHLFRHSLATNLVKKGANILTVQKQLRHKNLETTQIYIRSFPERVQDEYNFYKPNYI